jgi:hypothetical protein
VKRRTEGREGGVLKEGFEGRKEMKAHFEGRKAYVEGRCVFKEGRTAGKKDGRTEGRKKAWKEIHPIFLSLPPPIRQGRHGFPLAPRTRYPPPFPLPVPFSERRRRDEGTDKRKKGRKDGRIRRGRKEGNLTHSVSPQKNYKKNAKRKGSLCRQYISRQ